MHAIPTHICVKIDFKNAFNESERAAMVAAFAQHGTPCVMHRYLKAHLRPRWCIYYLSGGKLVLAEYRSSQGGQQASFEASGGFCVTTVVLFQEADKILAEGGGCARATCDNLTLCGPPVLVWRALGNLKRDAFMRLGLVLQESKTTVFAPLGAPRLETKPPGVKVGVNVGTVAARAGIIGHGLVIAGTPVGDKDFVMNYVTM